MSFYSGQKVTLKNHAHAGWRSSDNRGPLTSRAPVYGEVYTVDRCFKAPHDRDVECMFLVEFQEVPSGYRTPQPYEASAFRPVVERKTDISVFTKMLDDCEVTVE